MSDHGSRGWEATPTGWRCTECHGEVVGPVDVQIDDAHVCAKLPTLTPEQLHAVGRLERRAPRKRITNTPPPTREPIRLTAEERAHVLLQAQQMELGLRTDEAFIGHIESLLAARLAGGPTLADAWDEGWAAYRDWMNDGDDLPDSLRDKVSPYRTPESEDTE